jgi:hypothetical protein
MRMYKVSTMIVGLLAIAVMSTGCSVGMAMSGKEPPNLG